MELTRELKGHNALVNCLAIHPDGTTLASASGDGTLRLWHLATFTEIGILQADNQAGFWRCDFTSDGSSLVAIKYYPGNLNRELLKWKLTQHLDSAIHESE